MPICHSLPLQVVGNVASNYVGHVSLVEIILVDGVGTPTKITTNCTKIMCEVKMG
jgi:hypothetical protein